MGVSSFGESISELVENLTLWGNRKVLTGRAEADDEGPVMGDHRLIPFDLQTDLGKILQYPVNHVFESCLMVLIGDVGQIILQRFHKNILAFRLDDE